MSTYANKYMKQYKYVTIYGQKRNKFTIIPRCSLCNEGRTTVWTNAVITRVVQIYNTVVLTRDLQNVLKIVGCP